ncbi:hypothetical protein GCM10027075_51820 [Streptomyces heilongjiangensis]
MADGVHTPQGVGDGRPVTDVRVPPVHPGRDLRRGAVGGGQQCVEDAHRVPGADEGGDDMRADEARTSGDQDQHAPTVGPSMRPRADRLGNVSGS